MTDYNVYKDIAERTQGDVYIGIVGPVRTGKSTFIKRFMELLVLPNIENEYKRNRALDELPQSAGGKMIMTTEPKFIPNDAVEISLDDQTAFNVRLIDCVGYIVNGAMGHMEEDSPRMVMSPWSDTEIPFEQAAEIGTHKVISEHSTVGIVVTTDGTFSEIPRADYVEAEERVICELKDINKPFVIILNSADPFSNETIAFADSLSQKYSAKVIPLNCLNLNKRDVDEIMKCMLYEFPVCETCFYMPEWVSVLEAENLLRSSINTAVFESFDEAKKISDVISVTDKLKQYDFIKDAVISTIFPGRGSVEISITVDDNLYYSTLCEKTGFEIKNNTQLLLLLQELAEMKKRYEKVSAALEQVNQTGYGIVSPSVEELSLEEPEIVKQGSRFGVRLRASAPSIHMMCNKPKFLKTA